MFITGTEKENRPLASASYRQGKNLVGDPYINPFILETPEGVLAKSAHPDQMPYNVASRSAIFWQIHLNEHNLTSINLTTDSSDI